MRLCFTVISGEMESSAPLIKENLVMIALLVTLALLVVAAVTSTVVATARDGYRRVPVAQR